MIQKLDDLMTENIHTVAIAGHVRPDGDCYGSTTATWQYLSKYYPDRTVTLYLERCPDEFRFLKGMESVKYVLEDETPVDLFITCDVSTQDRIGVAGPLFVTAKHRVCFDHHLSNTMTADENYVFPEASSCAEVMFGFIPYERMDVDIASSIYTGIIHDTGVFQQNNTLPKTHRIAAKLLEKGVPAPRIVEETFNARMYRQVQIMGVAFCRSQMFFDGQAVGSYITQEDYRRFACTTADTQSIVAELRKTTDVEIAFFVYEAEPGYFRVSLRSKTFANVSELAATFGGGGHFHAAACSVEGTVEEIYAKVLPLIQKTLKNKG